MTPRRILAGVIVGTILGLASLAYGSVGGLEPIKSVGAPEMVLVYKENPSATSPAPNAIPVFVNADRNVCVSLSLPVEIRIPKTIPFGGVTPPTATSQRAFFRTSETWMARYSDSESPLVYLRFTCPGVAKRKPWRNAPCSTESVRQVTWAFRRASSASALAARCCCTAKPVSASASDLWNACNSAAWRPFSSLVVRINTPEKNSVSRSATRPPISESDFHPSTDIENLLDRAVGVTVVVVIVLFLASTVAFLVVRRRIDQHWRDKR